MSHALIIDDNMIVSRAIEIRLALLGFDSFDQAWTEGQAVEAAAFTPPDLVVVGDSVEQGSAMDAVRRITRERDVPVLVITGDRYRAARRLPGDASLSGPYLLDQIKGALASANVAC